MMKLTLRGWLGALMIAGMIMGTANMAAAADAGEPETQASAGIQAGFATVKTRIVEKLDIAALNRLAEKSSLLPIFTKGGPIMYPLLLASILALGTVLDRLVFLIGVRLRRDREGIKRFLAAIGSDDYAEAARVGGKSKDHIVRVLNYALAHRRKSVSNALLYAQEQEMKRFRRGIPILDTIITLAPLLGLLGTVTGMMGSFALIGGELSTPGAVTGGIAEALIATAFGLGIAITSLLPFNYLNAKMEEAQLEIEGAATRMQLLMNVKPAARTIRQARIPAVPTRQKIIRAEEPVSAFS